MRLIETNLPELMIILNDYYRTEQNRTEQNINFIRSQVNN